MDEGPEIHGTHDALDVAKVEELPTQPPILTHVLHQRASVGGSPACIVCGETDLSKKYRCPKCRSPYCSLQCYKSHKGVCTSAQPRAGSSGGVLVSRKRQRQEGDAIDLVVRVVNANVL